VSDISRCQVCERPRLIADSYDYNPLQVIMGEALGWYSADDGEICGSCMTNMLGSQ